MDFLMMVLPIILYVLGIVLVGILIIIGVKLIYTIDKTNDILDDVEKKSKSLNGVFEMVDNVTDSLSIISDTVVEGIVGLISRIFKKRKREKEIDEYE